MKETPRTRNTLNCELNKDIKIKIDKIKCLIFEYKAEKDKVTLSPKAF